MVFSTGSTLKAHYRNAHEKNTKASRKLCNASLKARMKEEVEGSTPMNLAMCTGTNRLIYTYLLLALSCRKLHVKMNVTLYMWPVVLPIL